MSKSRTPGSHSKNPPQAQISSHITAILCSRRGVVIATAVSLFVYLIIFHLSTSKTNYNDIIGQGGQHSSILVSDHIKATAPNPLDPIGKELELRRKLYEEKCSHQRQERYIWELFLHAPSKLAVCRIPKAGCTFWKRLFRYLNSEHNRVNISSPFDIDRIQAHFGPSTSLPTYDYHTPEGRIKVDASTKVMMVRSPYRRLWSAYVDKFVLPEWWLDHGKSIMFARKDVKNIKSCPDDIGFEEFLEYSLINHERHWRPITELCDPCTFRPKFIGHVDSTFMRDARYILATQGLGSLLAGYREDKRLTNDIENLIDYHFQLFQQRKPLHDCLTEETLAGRVWKALQLNGYFKLDHDFPHERVKAALNGTAPRQARDSVVEIFLEEFRRSPQAFGAWKSQRDVIFLEAYRNVSNVTKNKIVQRYYDDFDMFGFDKAYPGSLY